MHAFDGIAEQFAASYVHDVRQLNDNMYEVGSAQKFSKRLTNTTPELRLRMLTREAGRIRLPLRLQRKGSPQEDEYLLYF